MSNPVCLISAALVACSLSLCGCSNFSCCYTEVSPAEFQKKTRVYALPNSVLMPIEYRGSDERFAYFEFGRFLWFPELVKTPARNFDSADFSFGRFPSVEGVYYKPMRDVVLPGPALASDPGAIGVRHGPPGAPGRLQLLNEDAMRLTDDGRIELNSPPPPAASPVDKELANKVIQVTPPAAER